MTPFDQMVIEPLNADHDRSEFHCGVEMLDQYLKKQAKQDVKRWIEIGVSVV